MTEITLEPGLPIEIRVLFGAIALLGITGLIWMWFAMIKWVIEWREENLATKLIKAEHALALAEVQAQRDALSKRPCMANGGTNGTNGTNGITRGTQAQASNTNGTNSTGPK
jgi:hypothetical protein